jgi:hypothetical protein
MSNTPPAEMCHIFSARSNILRRLVRSDHRALPQILGGLRANRELFRNRRPLLPNRATPGSPFRLRVVERSGAVRRSVADVTLHRLHGTPWLDTCSVCSSWRAGVAATHRGPKPYLVACPFDPHRPYQSFLFSIDWIVTDSSTGTRALAKVTFRLSEVSRLQ